MFAVYVNGPFCLS